MKNNILNIALAFAGVAALSSCSDFLDKAPKEELSDASFWKSSTDAEMYISDMCALANASSLLQPSDEADTFVREATYLFSQVRTAYKQRSKGTPEKPGTSEPDGGTTDTPTYVYDYKE